VTVVFDDIRQDLGGNLRHGDVATFHGGLWKFLIERFAIRSMLDVGCGEGHAVKFFQSHGVLAHGIEGSILNIKRAVTPIALHDLLAGPYIMPVDLVWCCEVAEHIAEEKVDHLIDTLANGSVVAMTHAAPGQDGHHHVNLKDDAYWIDLMAKRGYVLDEGYLAYRQLANQPYFGAYFGSSGLLFLKQE
jgi:hypothetical protein